MRVSFWYHLWLILIICFFSNVLRTRDAQLDKFIRRIAKELKVQFVPGHSSVSARETGAPGVELAYLLPLHCGVVLLGHRPVGGRLEVVLNIIKSQHPISIQLTVLSSHIAMPVLLARRCMSQ